jgi:glutathione synthase
MRIAFVVDPLPSLKAYKDTSIAMMRAAQAAGHAVWAIQQEAIHWSRCTASAPKRCIWKCSPTTRTGSSRSIAMSCAARFRAVLMRKDPPFDIEYVTTTWLLERAEAEGARVFNRPRACAIIPRSCRSPNSRSSRGADAGGA